MSVPVGCWRAAATFSAVVAAASAATLLLLGATPRSPTVESGLTPASIVSDAERVRLEAGERRRERYRERAHQRRQELQET